jgi:tetratricopeptide (TPR) repeat protein
VIEQLDQRRTRGEPSFFVIVGASGAGKSSLLKAGVLPQLARKPRDWLMLPVMRPERSPMEGLAKALAHRLGKAEDWERWRDDLVGEDAAGHWRRLISNLRIGGQAGATVLIPIDQLEELFTVADATERAAFLKSMAVLLDPEQRLPVVVVATGRSDVLSGVLEQADAELAKVTTTWLLAPMPLDRVPQLIRGPADVAGLHIDDGLAERIAQHVETSEALPLLAHVLWQLHGKSAGDNRLTLEEYEALGDPGRRLNPIQNSIRHAADEALARAKPSDEQRAALRDAFIQLVSVRLEDSKRVRQLALEARLPKASLPLLAALEKARLLTRRASPDGVVVEVAHEALFKAWDTLDRWLTDEHDFLTDIERLKVAHEVWSRAPEPDKAEALLHGFLLSRARDWLEKYPSRFKAPNLRPIRSLIRASAAAEDAERVKQERARQYVVYGSVAAAIVGVALAVGAGWAAWTAYEAEQRSARNFEGAAGAISTLVEAVPLHVEPIAPFDTVAAMLAEAKSAIAKLPPEAVKNPRIYEYRAGISVASAELSYELALYRQMRREARDAQADYRLAEENSRNRMSDVLRARAGIARTSHLVGLTYKELEEEGGEGCDRAKDATDNEPKAGTVEANKLAFTSYREAIQAYDKLVANHASDPALLRWRLQRAEVNADLGDLHLLRMDDKQAAEDAYEAALKERMEVRAALGPGQQAPRIPKGLLEHDIGWMHNKLADVHRERRQYDKSLERFLIAEKLIEGIGDALQSNKHWLNHLVLVRNNIGLAHVRRDDLRLAEQSFRRAIVEAGELSRRYPENHYIASNLAWSHDNLAELLVKRGLAEGGLNDLLRAVEHLGLAHATRQKFVACKPLWKRDQVFNRAQLAAAEAGRASHPVEAAGHYAVAADTGWALADAKSHDDRLLAQLLYMAEYRHAAADRYFRFGHADKARAEVEKGLLEVAKFVDRADAPGFALIRDKLTALKTELAR